MTFKTYLKINGTALPVQKDDYSIDYSDVVADSGGVTEAGTTIRDVIREGVPSISVTLPVSASWLKRLRKYKKEPYLEVEWLDPEIRMVRHHHHDRRESLPLHQQGHRKRKRNAYPLLRGKHIPGAGIAFTTERSEILQEIIDNLAATTYTPFEAEIPGDPALDPMDVLSLTGGQAQGEIACITEIVYRINGKSSIKCMGENPRLNQAKSRYTKDIEGLLAQQEGVEVTSTFWMSDAYSAADMAVAEAETVVTATQFEIQTDKSRGEIIWTGAYSLDEPSVVTANVYLDDRLIYSCRDWRMAGNTILTVSTPFEIQRGDEGVHEVKVALACQVSEESDLTIMARQLASLENRVRQIEKGFANEIAVEEVIHGELAEAIGHIASDARGTLGTSGSFEVTEPVKLELMALLGGMTESVEGDIE